VTRLFAVGEFDETLIDAERFLAVQPEFELERGSGKIRMMHADPSRPAIIGSLITLEGGVTIPVPQTPREVGRRVADAIVRRSVMKE